MGKKYRVYADRWDVPETVCGTFTASSDKEAIERFKEITRQKSHSWDDLRLERVDVVERVKHIASFFRSEGKSKREFTVHK